MAVAGHGGKEDDVVCHIPAYGRVGRQGNGTREIDFACCAAGQRAMRTACAQDEVVADT